MGTPGYDAEGNLTSRVDVSGARVYTWDAENRLIRVTKDGAEVARYCHDPLGRRVQKITAAGTTTYTYAGMDILQERLNGVVTATYIHGPGIDEPLAKPDPAGVATYYHADGLGSRPIRWPLRILRAWCRNCDGRRVRDPAGWCFLQLSFYGGQTKWNW